MPNVNFLPTEPAKRALGLAGRRVIATCGLINPGKGIEYAIEALARVVEEFTDVLYLVVGETHPGVGLRAARFTAKGYRLAYASSGSTITSDL